MAPELHLKQAYTGYAADVWSLGIILYFMVNGMLPFNKKSQSELTAEVVAAKPDFKSIKLSS